MTDLERDRLDDDRYVDETATARVDDRRNVGVDAARERFGGRDLPASLAGMLVALAALLLLAGLASAAIGAIAFQAGVEGNENELSLGALNGFMVAVWFIVLGVVLAIVGAIADNSYNLFEDLRVAEATLPNWFSVEDVTVGAIISSLAFAVLMVVGAILGGIWGTRMHTRADREIAARYAGDAVERRSVIEPDVR